MSRLGNDLSRRDVFSRHLHADGRAGDCLPASTSRGKGSNLLQATGMARGADMHALAPTRRMNPKLESPSNIHLHPPGEAFADSVLELHLVIEPIERRMLPASYVLTLDGADARRRPAAGPNFIRAECLRSIGRQIALRRKSWGVLLARGSVAGL